MGSGKALKIILFYLTLFLTTQFNLYSCNKNKSVFTLDLKKDTVISTLALSTFFVPLLLMNNNESIPHNLDKNNVNALDRMLMFSYNHSFIVARHVLLPVLHGFATMTPLLAGGWHIRDDFNVWFTYGVMYAQAAFFAYGTRMFISKIYDRHRPMYYFKDSIDSYVVSNSFPSGSTAFAFMPAAFLSVTFSAEFPDSPWRIPVIAGSYTLATTVAATRIFSGRHFLTDVLAGAAIGSFYGWLIPNLHRRTNGNNMSFMFTGNGGLISLKF